MRQVEEPKERYDSKMRSIASGGETLGEGLLKWGREVMGLEINESYGQTECNMVVGNCAEVMKIIPNSMGRAIPGHVVEILNEDGEIAKPGEFGEIAIKRPDPVMFLGYWGNPEATREKFIGDWLRTGDMGMKDDNGYFWFIGREDDVINSGAYRIGPGEVEDCLIRHDAVALAAVVGIPDEMRGEIIKAFIVPKDGVKVDKALGDSIKEHVKSTLEAYAYPREIEFVEELPMTTTGKIRRKELRRMDMEKGKGSREGEIGLSKNIF
jgi:Acyl-coenzyme A synthetases/AMP-(fatty) acid ligases